MTGRSDIEITGLTADSRSVQPGYLFAALPGSQADGRSFISDAITRGAVAVLAPAGTEAQSKNIPVITDDNPRRRFALMAAEYYGRQPEKTVAVTGTNGKTSVAHFLQQIWAYGGLKAASLGTLGVHGEGISQDGSLTTPDPVTLHHLLADLMDQGVDHLAMEASSHGLDQFRLDGVHVRAAGFTNLSRDHMDYHGSMDAYLSAKKRLFTAVLVDDGTAVINADVEAGQSIIEAVKATRRRVLSYGLQGKDLTMQSVEPSPQGQTVALAINGNSYTISLPLVGQFQAMNMLCAVGLAWATGMDLEQALTGAAKLKGVPGRLEQVGETDTSASVFIDYAHTPDALATALEALRPHAAGRLVIVFGAGGDRDKGKRPLMGQTATAADIIYVTDDNPRTEDPATIRAEILVGCPDAIEIGDRKDAIATAVRDLKAGDVLLIAGKGHETGQIIGDVTLPFSDRVVAREALAISGVSK